MERNNPVYSPAFILCFLCASLLLCNSSYASGPLQERNGLTDNIIGSTFKSLAKAFILTADIEKIKLNNIEKLNKIDEIKFRKRYAQVYEVIKECPSAGERYGLNDNLTKQEAIKGIKSLDKKKAYEIIDSIPNSLISNQFMIYLKKKKEEIQRANVVLKIKEFWSGIILKAFAK